MAETLNLIRGDGIKFHEDPKRKDMVFPQGMTFENAIETIKRIAREQLQYIETSPVYLPYLLDDGLVAAHHVSVDMFGMAQASGGLFDPPKMRLVKTSLTESVEVPFGAVAIPALVDPEGQTAKVYLDQGVDPAHPDRGLVFRIRAYVRRMDQHHITEFVKAVEKRLKTHSIYRGQALTINAGGSLDFVDLTRYADPDKIVFTDSVQDALDTAIFAPLRNRQELLKRGIPQKRNSVLYGPFGTGKSSAGGLTARVAVATGHTFIACGPSSNMNEVARVAGLYEPSVGFAEDIDNVANVSDAAEVSNLLEAFDGLSTKGSDVKLVMTTNNLDRIHPGMFRPGRVDNWIYVGSPDRPTVERLIKANAGEELAEDIDWDAVWVEVDGFTPAYVQEVLTKAVIRAVDHAEPGAKLVLTTSDLVGAARLVQGQWKLQQDAVEPPKPPTLDQAFGALTKESAEKALEAQSELLLEKAYEGTGGHLGTIRELIRDNVQDALDSTKIMDPRKNDVKGALDVQ